MSLAKLNVTKKEKINGGSMKKLMVSLMLIISMFAFAAESAPSATVGYVKYPCVVGKTFVALPMQDTFTTASTLSANINTVLKFNPATQLWETAYKGGLGWVNNFAVTSGNPYLVNVPTTAFDFIVDDEVAVNSAYNIIPLKNAVMVPLDKSEMTLASHYETQMGTGSINTVLRFNSATQLWNTAYKGGLGWVNNFAIGIADPHLINSTITTTWPSTKEVYADGNENALEAPLAPKAESRMFIVRVKDRFDAEYTAANIGGVTFKAWFTERPTEIINESSPISSVYMYFDLVGVCSFDFQLFTSPWGVGDHLTVLCKDENEGLKAYYEGTANWIVDDLSATAMEYGFSDYGFGVPGAAPVLLSTPSSIDGEMLPMETKLHQNYPNPFNPTTTIKFDLNSDSVVKLNVYNYNGQMVKSLVDGSMKAGFHTVNFDASNLSAGVYYYTMETANKTMTQKMVLVK